MLQELGYGSGSVLTSEVAIPPLMVLVLLKCRWEQGIPGMVVCWLQAAVVV